MDIAKLRHRITIEEPIETLTDAGEVAQTWTTFATVWAQITPLASREYWASRQVNAEVTGQITIRSIDGIDSKMRVKFGIRIFNILAVINIEEKKQEMLLLVKEGSSG